MKLISRFNFGVILLIFIAIMTTGFVMYKINDNKIYKGISIGNVDFSGLTKDQAIQRLNSEVNKYNKSTLIIDYLNKEWDISNNDLNIKFNVEKTIDDAYSYGRNGSIFKRISEIINLSSGKIINVELSYNETFLRNKLTEISQDIEKKFQNAAITIDNSQVNIIPHANGKKLNIDKSIKSIDSNIRKLSTQNISLVVDDIKPKIVKDDLIDIKDEISVYYTTFNENYAPRAHNIRLASSRINGIILMPGEVFSMDKTIKNRTSANGYLTAKAYLNDEIVEELGGGVCQITTTMYDAALLADLKIIERNQHSMLVGYVPPGFDAAISDKGLDLKFENSNKYPIYIHSGVEGNKLTIKMYGKNENPNKKIELESQVDEVSAALPEQIAFDDNLSNGAKKIVTSSKNGCKASLYKNVYVNGKLTSREKISKNEYEPLRGKILIGR